MCFTNFFIFTSPVGILFCGLAGSCDPPFLLSIKGTSTVGAFGERVLTSSVDTSPTPGRFGGTDSTPFPRVWKGLLLIAQDPGLTSDGRACVELPPP